MSTIHSLLHGPLTRRELLGRAGMGFGLQRLQDRQFAAGMEAAWMLIAVGGVPNPTPIDTSLNARLQRDADSAISRCISPMTAHA